MRIRSLRLPEVRKVEDWFAYCCPSLVNLQLPELKEAANFLAVRCFSLVSLPLPTAPKGGPMKIDLVPTENGTLIPAQHGIPEWHSPRVYVKGAAQDWLDAHFPGYRVSVFGYSREVLPCGSKSWWTVFAKEEACVSDH